MENTEQLEKEETLFERDGYFLKRTSSAQNNLAANQICYQAVICSVHMRLPLVIHWNML
jgi:hypothetical protein